jgi:P27 family predicted phage terminase small subunit
MSGPPPIPTALKLLHGNPGRHKLNKHEPVPAGKLADDDPPDWFSTEQTTAWHFALDNAPPALLRRIDRATLVAWVTVEDLHRRAAMALNESGLMARIGDVTLAVPSPHVAMMLKATAVMVRLANEMGFTPAARARIYAGAQNSAPEAPPTTTGGKWNDEAPIPLAEYLASRPL